LRWHLRLSASWLCLAEHTWLFALSCSLIDKKNARRYDDCLKYTMVSGKKALAQAGLDKEANASAFSQLNLARCGVLVGSGMGGLQVFQDGE
jgi:3-oxoacyl-[acyl-carrier-protein] synthase II